MVSDPFWYRLIGDTIYKCASFLFTWYINGYNIWRSHV